MCNKFEKSSLFTIGTFAGQILIWILVVTKQDLREREVMRTCSNCSTKYYKSEYQDWSVKEWEKWQLTVDTHRYSYHFEQFVIACSLEWLFYRKSGIYVSTAISRRWWLENDACDSPGLWTTTSICLNYEVSCVTRQMCDCHSWDEWQIMSLAKVVLLTLHWSEETDTFDDVNEDCWLAMIRSWRAKGIAINVALDGSRLLAKGDRGWYVGAILTYIKKPASNKPIKDNFDENI